ncbi:MAG: FAD-dependent oxidoreductase [Chloroflexota bacterium]
MIPDTLIIGGGIYGLTAALALQGRGRQVAVIDHGPVPHPLAASTDISKVVRVEYGADEQYTALAERAREGWLRWNEEFGEELYHEDGLLMLTQEAMRPGGFTYESYHLLTKRGHDLERLDGETVARRYPAWNAQLYCDGYFNPRGGYAESGRMVLALAQRAKEAGIAFYTGKFVDEIVQEAGRVRGVRLGNGQQMEAAEVVVAAGAWTPLLVPELQDVMVAVGQPVFHLQPQNPDVYRPPHFHTFAAAVSRTGWYGFSLHPRENVIKIANHGVGLRIDPRHDERRVTDEQVGKLRDFLAQTFPKLADAPLIYTRLCLYCDVRDGHFWIDRHPDIEGLAVASGGSGHGFKFAPVLGDLIADAVEGKENGDLARFRWRELDDATVIEEATRYQQDAKKR